MSEVMSEAGCLDYIGVNLEIQLLASGFRLADERLCYSTSYLRHLKGVGQSIVKYMSFVCGYNLSHAR
jgi:hypothetical protein